MFCLHAGQLNEVLCDRAEKLKDKITMFEVEENRKLNKEWERMLFVILCLHLFKEAQCQPPIIILSQDLSNIWGAYQHN